MGLILELDLTKPSHGGKYAQGLNLSRSRDTYFHLVS